MTAKEEESVFIRDASPEKLTASPGPTPKYRQAALSRLGGFKKRMHEVGREKRWGTGEGLEGRDGEGRFDPYTSYVYVKFLLGSGGVHFYVPFSPHPHPHPQP